MGSVILNEDVLLLVYGGSTYHIEKCKKNKFTITEKICFQWEDGNLECYEKKLRFDEKLIVELENYLVKNQYPEMIKSVLSGDFEDIECYPAFPIALKVSSLNIAFNDTYGSSYKNFKDYEHRQFLKLMNYIRQLFVLSKNSFWHKRNF